jgi:hypothetical protein
MQSHTKPPGFNPFPYMIFKYVHFRNDGTRWKISPEKLNVVADFLSNVRNVCFGHWSIMCHQLMNCLAPVLFQIRFPYAIRPGYDTGFICQLGCKLGNLHELPFVDILNNDYQQLICLDMPAGLFYVFEGQYPNLR